MLGATIQAAIKAEVAANRNDGIVIDGIKFSHFSRHAIMLRRSDNSRIINNEAYLIGGYQTAPSGYVGNPFNIMDDCLNCAIDYNIIDESFDVGVSIQNHDSAGYTCSGHRLTNNIIKRSGMYGIGLAIGNGANAAVIDDIEISGNHVSDSGGGWAHHDYFNRLSIGIAALCYDGLASITNINIENNYVTDCYENGRFVTMSTSIDIHGNHFNAGKNYGIRLLATNAAGAGSALNIYSNIFTNDAANSYSIMLDNSLSAAQSLVSNNLIYNCYNGITTDIDTGYTTPLVKNNIVYDCARGLYSLGSEASYTNTNNCLFSQSIGNFTGGVINGSNNKLSDPKLLSPSVGKYELGANSPCIGKGTDTGVTDYNGESFTEGHYDIGPLRAKQGFIPSGLRQSRLVRSRLRK